MITDKEKLKHIEMIKDPWEWPRYPFLPLKRYVAGQSWPDTGVIWSGAPLRVVRDEGYGGGLGVNVFSLPKTKEEFLALKHVEYKSAEAIVDDGWIVD